MELKIVIITGSFVLAAAAIPIIFNYLSERIKASRALSKEYREKKLKAYSSIFKVLSVFIRGEYSVSPDPNAITSQQQMNDVNRAFKHKLWELKTHLEAVTAEYGIWLEKDEEVMIEKIIKKLEQEIFRTKQHLMKINHEELIKSIEEDNFNVWVKELQKICKLKLKKLYQI